MRLRTTLRLTAGQIADVREHLFREDHDEHAAILLVGSRVRPGRTTLLARELHLLSDDEFPPGEHGYRQIAPQVLARLGNRAFTERLGLISLHSHPGADRDVCLSGDDLAGHRRVFGHLLDIVGGRPVGGLALGQRAADGEIWLKPEVISRLEKLEVVGERMESFGARPAGQLGRAGGRYDRQIQLFGTKGQRLLGGLRVAVVGLGGGGSLLVEQLAHLGVGEIIAVDFDTVAEHNLSRIVGATARDARRHTKKVQVSRRLVRRIDPSVRFTTVDGDVVDADVAAQLTDVDWILLASDTHSSRLVVNAIAQAYLIPTVQIGAKVDGRADGTIEQIYCAVRPVLAPEGCLYCAGVIDQQALQRETATEEERVAQDYLGGDSGVVDPSVITLNAVGAAGAMNVLLLSAVGLGQSGLGAHQLHTPADGAWLKLQVERDPACLWCSAASHSRFARGDDASLPVRRSDARRPHARPWRFRPAWGRLRRPRGGPSPAK